ncbi:MAG: endonuclease/exonuclease/phosphatase family protein [Chloroflexota bacterium]
MFQFWLLPLVLVLAGAGPRAQGDGAAGARTFEIQGAGHVSPLVGQMVQDVPGVVTALRSNGFYLQDADGDGRPETSDAVFAFTGETPTVLVGDSVRVSGQVREFRAGGDEAGLSTTEIAVTGVAVMSHEQPPPAPVVLGPGGLVVPTRLLAEGVEGDLEAGLPFRPDQSALDFFESLEGMRVQLDDAVVVGRRSGMGELPVLPANGDSVTRRTVTGGLLAPSALGEAPPRILLADGAVRTPPASVGDRLPGRTVGVVEYAFGGYRVRVSELPSLVPAGTAPERVAPDGTADRGVLSVATFNVENLSARERPARLARLAETIVQGLGGPDLVVLQELQDDSGAGDDGVVTAGRTARALTEAIRAAGGPEYAFREIAPENNQDGGEPGGNIRVGMLFRTDRGLAFVDRPGGDAVTPVAVVPDPGDGLGPTLSLSPGRVAPADPAWQESRKPLAAELTFNGHRLIVVGCHFGSKRGDGPLFGRIQPPARPSEARRVAQAQLVRAFVESALAANPTAKTIVLGDLNDTPGSAALLALTRASRGDDAVRPLTDLLERLPEPERYSYVFGGQSEAIDHILVSLSLLGAVQLVDVVHGNAGFASGASDHDPVLARFSLPPR